MTETATPKPRSLVRRILKGVAISVGVCVGVVALAVTGTILWLNTDGGQAFILRQVLTAASGSLAGRLEIDRFHLTGLLRIEADAIRLYPPLEINPAISTGKVFIDVRLLDLLRNRVEVQKLFIDHPRVRMIQEGLTTNLGRALSEPFSEVPRPPPRPSKLPHLGLHAPEIHIREGGIDMNGAWPIGAGSLNIDLALDGFLNDLGITASIHGQILEPAERALHTELKVRYLETAARIDLLSTTVGESEVIANGSGDFDGSRAVFNLQKLFLTAADVNAFLPEAALLGDLGVAAKGSLEEKQAQAHMAMDLPSGAVTLDLSALFGPKGFADLLQYEATAAVDTVDIARIRKDLPVARVNARLHIKGEGVPLTGTADIELDGAGSRYEKLTVDRLGLKAHLDGRIARIDQLDLKSANVVVGVSGTANEEGGDLNVTIDAPSLSETRILLAHGLSLTLPAMDGAANVSAHTAGHWLNPHGTLSVDASRILIGTTRIGVIRTSATLDGIEPEPRGSFSIAATGVTLNGKAAGDISMAGSVDARTAHLDGGGQLDGSPASLTLRAGHSPGHAWSFGTFKTTILGTTVRSETPFTVAVEEGRFRIQHLNLSGDLGRIALNADVAPKGAIDGHLTLQDIRADKLPKIFLPDDWNLAGTLNVTADVHGTVENPTADLKASIHGAQFRALSNMGLEANVHVASLRASGKLDAHVASSTVGLTFDAPLVQPVKAFASNAPVLPISAALDVHHLLMKEISPVLPKPLPVTALIEGHLDIRGTTRNPVLRTNWSVADLATGVIDKVRTDLALAYTSGEWKADVQVNRPEAVSVKAAAQVKVTVADLISGRALKDPDLGGSATVDILSADLKWLSQIGYGPSDLAGIVTGQLKVDGTRRNPISSGAIVVSDLAAAGYQNVGVQVGLKTSDRIDVKTDVTLAGVPAVSLTAGCEASPARLATMTSAELLAMLFSLHVELAPTPVEKLLPPVVPGMDPPNRPYHAIVGATIDAHGSANDPVLAAHVAVDEVNKQNASVGVLTADLGYQDSHLLLTSLFQSKSVGELRARLELSPRLGVSALQAAGDKALASYSGPAESKPSAIVAGVLGALGEPATITVDTTEFDLALANGFVGVLYDLGGKLDLHLRKTGPLVVFGPDGSLKLGATLAELNGKLLLDRAKVSVLGFGSFSDLRLKASGLATSVEVTELSGRSGKGSFDGTISLTATTASNYKGSLKLNLVALPIVQDFQTRGFISLQILASGTGSPGKIDIPLIELRQGHAVIPEKLPRNIQTLTPNPDIEFADAKPQAPEKAVDPGSAWLVHIGQILIPDDFVVDAPLGTHLTLGADLALSAGAADGPPVDVTGDVHIVNGHINLLRRFDVDSGVLTFRPGEVENPGVNVRAHYDGPDATVKVLLSGTVEDLQQRFESNPSMSENEILSYLATGQRQTRAQDADPSSLQGQLADAALSALGAAAIGVVQGAVMQFLPQELGPDVLTVETNVAKGTVGRVRAGKYYLKGKLYVGGQYNPSANPLLNQNQYEGEADYRIGSNQTLRLIVGTEGHHSLYFLVERSFKAKRQKEPVK